jgi:hypothetical protein
MAIYTVLDKPNRDPAKAIFVPEGFAFAAFVFTALWALWHRMWVVTAMLFAFWVAMSVAVSFGGLDPVLAAVIELGVALVFGFEARRLQVMSLLRSGYAETGTVSGSTLAAAELTYFAEGVAERGRGPWSHPRDTGDHLGLFGAR